MQRIPPRKSVAYLKDRDPRLARAIEAIGPFRLVPRREGSAFSYLARAIVYQQLSGKAAATIWGRVLGIYGHRLPSPSQVLATPDAAFREAGLSRQKLGYFKDLAARVADGTVPVARLDELPDEDIVAHLTRVKGIGVWTAQMYLLFRLGRPNVLPDTDLGIQKGLKKVYGLRKLPTPERVRREGRKWEPYCTVASWYLWRSLDTVTL